MATILSSASAPYTASGVTGPLPTYSVSELALDANVTVITGGTSPSITFYLDRLGADGVWYRMWTSAGILVAGSVSTSVDPDGGATNAVLTDACRFGWTFGGTVAATSITFSASVVVR